MTTLSPAAQAVLNAVEAVSEYGKATPLMKARLAAALRFAAGQQARAAKLSTILRSAAVMAARMEEQS